LCDTHRDWVQGYCDETWWSRFAQPSLSAWAEEGQPLRLVEKTKAKDDPDPKALACYGLLLRWMKENGQIDERILLRFVDGRPVSDITVQFLEWCCARLEVMNKRVLALIWDNASWHISKRVSAWIRAHNRQVKRSGQGVRILACRLPVKSPWLNPIEPKWTHSKRRVVEPNGTLSTDELAERICATFGCEHHAHLSIPENVS
jgi:transposase